MYLARQRCGATTTYQIRQSYADPGSGWYRHRLIFDLGENPADHLEPLGEIAVFFSSALEKAVSGHTSAEPGELLVKLLWDFLPRATRERLSRFDRSGNYVPGPLTASERAKIEEQIHLFDRRRLYYLRYRAIDQSRLFTMRERVYRPLLDQSRDEREYHFARLEQSLSPGEYRNYLYAAFNLQRYFTVSFATYLPEALPEDEVADSFLEALCQLNTTLSFWQTEPIAPALHPHLVRYLVMFFDFTPATRTLADDYVRRFMNSHRTFRWPDRAAALDGEEVSRIFGFQLAELKKMSRRELKRLYRRKAKALHPDQGGDQARFVELTEVYNTLLKKAEEAGSVRSTGNT